MSEPAVIRTTLRPFRVVFVVSSLAEIDTVCEICDGALGGRLNLLLPTTARATDDVLRMLEVFDPDVIAAGTPSLPPALAALRLPSIGIDAAGGACFPLGLVSNLRESEHATSLLAAAPDAPRHVRLNVGVRSAEQFQELEKQLPSVAVQEVSTVADVFLAPPAARWSRLCGPIGLYGYASYAGDAASEADRLPAGARVVVVSSADDTGASCFFWNFRAFDPDVDVLWIPSPEIGKVNTRDDLRWIWFESAGEPPPTVTPRVEPHGYFYRRYGDALWSSYSSLQPAAVGRRHLRVVHPYDRKPNTIGFDLALCLQVDEFPDFAGPVSVATGSLFSGRPAGRDSIKDFVRCGRGHLVQSVFALRPGQNEPLIVEYQRPAPDDLLRTLMAERGVILTPTPKTRLIRELGALFGRLDRLSVLRDRRVFDQFVSMAPRRAERIAKELHRLSPNLLADALPSGLLDLASELQTVVGAQPRSVRMVIQQLGRDSAALVDRLCEMHLLLPGKAFPCVHCEAPLWFPLAALGTADRCYCCNRSIRVPVALDGAPLGDSLKLNELVSKGVDQGALPTLLLAHLIHKQHFSTPRFAYDHEMATSVHAGPLGDLDLVFTFGHRLGLAETKASRPFDVVQSERLCGIAEEIGADVVVFATLLRADDSRLTEFESSLALQEHRYPILLVTGDDFFDTTTFDIGTLFSAGQRPSVVRAASLPRLAEWPDWARNWGERYGPGPEE